MFIKMNQLKDTYQFRRDSSLPLKFAIIGSAIVGAISFLGEIIEHAIHGHLFEIVEHAGEFSFYVPLLVGVVVGGFLGFLYGKRVKICT